LVVATALVRPTPAAGDTGYTFTTRELDTGKVLHVVPRQHPTVRMAAERVVLVPLLLPGSGIPRMLVHVWYDFDNPGPAQVVSAGFPELAGSRSFNQISGGGAHTYGQPSDQRDTYKGYLPTIKQFSARIGGKWLKVRPHPGVTYRRWFTFGLPLPTRGRARLHNQYIASIGRHLQYNVGRGFGYPNDELLKSTYRFHYLLHTGASWKGTIGKGEVLIFARGRLVRVRQFTNLEPTRKDDVYLSLKLGTAQRSDKGNRDVTAVQYRERFVQQSSLRPGPQVDAVGALAVDGDPQTAWISQQKRAKGAWLQIPTDPGRALKGLQVLAGVRPTGAVRPARLRLFCMRAGTLDISPSWRVLTTVTLGDTAGPQPITFKPTKGCDAVKLYVMRTHGDAGASVFLAEVTQQYTKAPAPGLPGMLKVVRPRPAKASKPGGPARPAKRKSPFARPGQLGGPPRGHETAEVTNVRWSLDGTLVHYRVRRANRLYDPHAVIWGVFRDVSTGKVIRRYRMDKAGTLPEPYRRQWAGAWDFTAAAKFLERTGFVAGVARRAAPRGAPKGLSVRLEPSKLPRKQGGLQVLKRRGGFYWWYSPNTDTAAADPVSAELALIARRLGKPGRALLRHRPRLHHGFGQLHAKLRARRLKAYTKCVNTPPQERNYDKFTPPTAKEIAQGFARSNTRSHAYWGQVHVHWHPRGESVLLVWRDFVELGALLAKPAASVAGHDVAADCDGSGPTFDRSVVQVFVHSFVAKSPTTLLKPLPKPTSAPARPKGSATAAPPAAVAMKATGRDSRAKKRARRPSGCGCVAPGASASSGLLWLFVLGALLARRRRMARRTRMSGRAGRARVGHEQTVWSDAVKVDVEIQGPAEALHEGDGATVAVFDARYAAAVALPGADALEISAEHGRQEPGVWSWRARA